MAVMVITKIMMPCLVLEAMPVITVSKAALAVVVKVHFQFYLGGVMVDLVAVEAVVTPLTKVVVDLVVVQMDFRALVLRYMVQAWVALCLSEVVK